MRDLQELGRQVEQLAKAAGERLAEKRGKHNDVMTKASQMDLVTDMDKATERYIVSLIREWYPEDLILSEEDAFENSWQVDSLLKEEQYCWVIDPIDGTTNFIHGIPYFTVSIGIVKNGKTLVGAVYEPSGKEMFTSIRGRGAFLNGEPIHVSSRSTVGESLLHVSYSSVYWRPESELRNEMAAFFGKCRNIKHAGASSLDLCYLACGRIDGFWHLNPAPWDIAAAILILEEAGGKLTSISGEAFTWQECSVLASNNRIHEEILSIKEQEGY
ncbi:inositol monophosphatase family protein [Brevibacillus sp. NRS-1366]|uniref:inositol monophosphatase family protein n=1 Tax=Brevibacillus sp. NRS-1366 TaxID=3233899 RepID=UPI003D1E6C28